MCGIFGFARKAGPLSVLDRHKLRGIVMDLTYRNEIRGRDGTGLALFSAAETLIFKEALPPEKLIKTKRFQGVVRAITDKTQICLGHTRLATIGAVQNEHCHPFVTEHFVGAHNGHFMNREFLLKKFARTAATPVDSEAIFRVLDGENDMAGMIAKLSLMQGDFAISFVRRGDPYRLYLIRNAERPLHVAYLQQLRTLFWSSDGSHLEFALARNGFKAGVWALNEDYLYVADVRSFARRSHLRKTICKMEPFDWQGYWSEEDYMPAREPRLFSYEELEGFGCFERVAADEYSKIPCHSCQEVVEAGKLFYEELSGKFLCERCSFEHLCEYEKRKTEKIPSGETRDLFEFGIA